MERSKVVGGLLILASVVVALLYLYGMYFTGYDIALVKATLSILVILTALIVSWIGYTLLTAPPPKPIEEIEKEIEEELRRLEIDSEGDGEEAPQE